MTINSVYDFGFFRDDQDSLKLKTKTLLFLQIKIRFSVCKTHQKRLLNFYVFRIMIAKFISFYKIVIYNSKKPQFIKYPYYQNILKKSHHFKSKKTFRTILCAREHKFCVFEHIFCVFSCFIKI